MRSVVERAVGDIRSPYGGDVTDLAPRRLDSTGTRGPLDRGTCLAPRGTPEPGPYRAEEDSR